MRWLDAVLPELFYGALVSVAVLVVAWALLETWDPHREFIAEAKAHADGPVGKPPAELARLNERDEAYDVSTEADQVMLRHASKTADEDDFSEHYIDDDVDLRADLCTPWPGDVAEGDDTPWLDAGTARLRQALADTAEREATQTWRAFTPKENS